MADGKKVTRCPICSPRPEDEVFGGVYFLDEEVPVGENKRRDGWQIHCEKIHEGASRPTRAREREGS